MSGYDKTSRRGFIGLLGAAAGLSVVALAPGLRLIEASQAGGPGEGVSGRVRWGMLIDSRKCSPGCDDCVKACAVENGINEKVVDSRQSAQWIRKVELKEVKSGRQHSLPMMCQHCAKPACVDVCPTGASFKRPDGIVLVDRHSCIGCRYCMMACPYKARSFVHQPLTEQKPNVPRGLGCVESCNFCVHRVDRGQMPACVESCPEGAMLFGDLNDPNSEISLRISQVNTKQIREDLRLDTGVRYQGI